MPMMMMASVPIVEVVAWTPWFQVPMCLAPAPNYYIGLRCLRYVTPYATVPLALCLAGPPVQRLPWHASHLSPRHRLDVHPNSCYQVLPLMLLSALDIQ